MESTIVEIQVILSGLIGSDQQLRQIIRGLKETHFSHALFAANQSVDLPRVWISRPGIKGENRRCDKGGDACSKQ
jgi:hypothetical protein